MVGIILVTIALIAVVQLLSRLNLLE